MANVLIKEEVLLIDEPIDFAHPLDPNAVDGWWWIEPDVASELLELLTVQDVQKRHPSTAEKAPEDAWAPSDDLTAKLEAFGYDVGYRFVERFSRDRPRLLEPLDVIKFLCKDFWIHIFKKQIDKLQTNHRVRVVRRSASCIMFNHVSIFLMNSLSPLHGVFVLQDFNFRWIQALSGEHDAESKQKALVFLVFPCGLLRGALANLGILAIVNADLNAVPGCTSYAFLRFELIYF
ncbi:hypothetical protein DYB28_004757 [Aphanomyces astaci]|uniref:Trafficking protein particle complex subunit 6B n=1 Tax=Aphanomyces astaci TaxID=112090 RepID=A0A9X8DMD2_APHAT|nr:hypothetical protein DYB28_004757 [Aphanomyces astaci]